MLSPMAASLAEKMGYSDIRVFHAGAPAWQQEGHPLLTTQKFIAPRLDNVVLIDTRGAGQAKQGHIEGAFAIGLDQIVAQKDQFPLDTSVPVVLYAQETALDSLKAVVSELAMWVDHPLFVLKGGYAGWAASNGPTASEKIRTRIVYLPKPGPGEIVGDEFMNIVKGEPEDKVILDVRTPAEAAQGKIAWSTNIPLDDLQTRLAELPKGKEIIVHCGTGMRASMAYAALQNAGFQARYLDDKVGFMGEAPICCYKE